MIKILLVEDDLSLSNSVYDFLENFADVVQVFDGDEGLYEAEMNIYDIILLDLMLPEKNGFEVLAELRAKGVKTPVLIMTAKESLDDKMHGFEIGADDYLPKPCNPRELVARLRAILRRTQKIPTQRPIIEHQGILVDCSKRLATHNGEPMDLTNAEFNILEMLIKSPGQAFSKEELTEYALGRKYTTYDRSIDVHISNLRNKLGDNQAGEPFVKTVRGFGYMFNA